MGRKGMRNRATHGAWVQRDSVWKAMRQLRRFTFAELEAVTETSHAGVRKYVCLLVKAGYARVATPARCVPGDSAPAVYELIRNTGPVAPRMTLDGVFDANIANPYDTKPGKRLNRHAPALLRALRNLVEAVQVDGGCFDKPLQDAIDSLRAHDEDSR